MNGSLGINNDTLKEMTHERADTIVNNIADDIPEWSGLMYAHKHERDGKAGVHFEIIKNAPKLHNIRPDPKVIEHVKSVFYWRFWTERNKN